MDRNTGEGETIALPLLVVHLDTKNGYLEEKSLYWAILSWIFIRFKLKLKSFDFPNTLS